MNGITMNKKTLLNNRGVMLLQTIIMAIILSLLSVMTLKWILGRYSIVNKLEKSAEAKAAIEGCIALKTQAWMDTGLPPACNNGSPAGTCTCSVGKYTVNITVNGPLVTYTVDKL